MKSKKQQSAKDETYLKLYNQILQKEKTKSNISMKVNVRNLLSSSCYRAILVICIALTLFFDDFRQIVAFRTTDPAFYGITIVVIVFFVIGNSY